MMGFYIFGETWPTKRFSVVINPANPRASSFRAITGRGQSASHVVAASEIVSVGPVKNGRFMDDMGSMVRVRHKYAFTIVYSRGSRTYRMALATKTEAEQTQWLGALVAMLQHRDHAAAMGPAAGIVAAPVAAPPSVAYGGYPTGGSAAAAAAAAGPPLEYGTAAAPPPRYTDIPAPGAYGPPPGALPSQPMPYGGVMPPQQPYVGHPALYGQPHQQPYYGSGAPPQQPPYIGLPPASAPSAQAQAPYSGQPPAYAAEPT